jgi:hypothetical protein
MMSYHTIATKAATFSLEQIDHFLHPILQWYGFFSFSNTHTPTRRYIADGGHRRDPCLPTPPCDNCHMNHRLSCVVRRLPDGVILRHRTTDVTVRQWMISMILTTTSNQFHFSMDGLLPVLVMENILMMSSCPNHHCCPLLPNPLPLPSDDGTIQQSTKNQSYLNAN